MQLATLNDLFLHELKDLYDAEHQLVEALPKLADASTSPELSRAFRNHLEETKGHVSRLETIFRELGEEPDRETCKGMRGLIAEGEKLLKEVEEPDLLDAALISAAQRVEHYEISAYGTLRVWAATAGLDGVQEEIDAILEEEKAADATLSEIAESEVNPEAESPEGSNGGRKRSNNRSRSKPARSRRTTRSRS
jgi:ferritin-like metal-binding protein YciE